MDKYETRHVKDFEKLNKLGSGTYGTVWRARDKTSGEIVALKQIHLTPCKNGFPVTSVREIKILMLLHHPNIVHLKGVCVGSKPNSVFLVFEYCEHDLAKLLEAIHRPFNESEIKTILLQLLSAVQHLHSNFVLHRDIKLSNLLMNATGTLKLADFGLARVFGSPLEPLTPKVVTLWYRPPEILLGCAKYHTACDIWAIGCIFAELVKRQPLLPGQTDWEQLEKIFELLGTPNERIWPGFSDLPLAPKAGAFPKYVYNNLSHKFSELSPNGIDFLSRLLTYDPSQRITAEKALQHPYFKEKPYPCDQKLMPSFPSTNTRVTDVAEASEDFEATARPGKRASGYKKKLAAAMAGGIAGSVLGPASKKRKM